MIASHYAEPVARALNRPATLRAEAGEGSPELGQFEAGTRFDLLDDRSGWAWGYAGDERLVGYVPSAVLG